MKKKDEVTYPQMIFIAWFIGAFSMSAIGGAVMLLKEILKIDINIIFSFVFIWIVMPMIAGMLIMRIIFSGD